MLKYCQTFRDKFKRQALKYFLAAFKNPKWFIMFCVSRIQVFRACGIYISKRPGYPIINIDKLVDSIFPEVNVDLVVGQLRNDGLYIGINLPQNILPEILSFSQSIRYFANANTELSFILPEKKAAELKYQQKFITAYQLNPTSLCTAVKKVEQDPKLWEIAGKYLETNPCLIETKLWWTFATQEAVDRSLALPFEFHYDLEDFRFIKFMFYLQDVDRFSGPHVCVKGSHNQKKLSHQFNLIRETSESEIFDYYGSDKVQTIYGKAGLGFVEDFYCFHRGIEPIEQDRLILEVKFAMNNYANKPK